MQGFNQVRTSGFPNKLISLKNETDYAPSLHFHYRNFNTTTGCCPLDAIGISSNLDAFELTLFIIIFQGSAVPYTLALHNRFSCPL